MKRSRFTEEQIIGILKEQEVGAKTADACRKYGISEATFYKYKAKYGGMDVSDARKLKTVTGPKCARRASSDQLKPKQTECPVKWRQVQKLGSATVRSHLYS